MPEAEPKPPVSLEEQFATEAIPLGLPWRLMVFAIIIFAFSISIYFGLFFGYSSYLKSEAQAIDKKIDELANQVSQQDQQNFINFYSQLVNLKKVLDQHVFSSNIFGYLERNTLPTVYYPDAQLSVDTLTVNLHGEAESSETLTQQLNTFNKTPEIDKIILDQINFDAKGGRVGFSALLVFKPEFLSRLRQ